MKHLPEMTFKALSARADEVDVSNTVADYLGGEDYREISVFLEVEQSCDMRYGENILSTEAKRIIGVALCDLDDPQADIEILDRDAALEMFGQAWADSMEAME